MPPFVVMTGVEEVDRRLKLLAFKGQKTASRKAMTAGLRVLVIAIKAAAPVKKGNLRRSIRSRFLKFKEGDGKTVAKAGPDVGIKQPKGQAKATHGHLVTLGTAERWRKKLGGYYSLQGRKNRSTLHTVVQKKKKQRQMYGPVAPRRIQTVHGVGFYTGKARPDGFVARAEASSDSAVKSAIIDRMPGAIAEEWKKSK